MLPVTLDDVRLFLHLLAATVWVGGQLVLLGLLPTVRELGEGAPAAVARRFAALSWPAFAVLVVTGIWNLLDVGVGDTSTEYQVTLGLKLGLVAVSGIGAGVHAATRSRAVLAIGGAAGLLAALGATLLGVVLAG